MRSWFTTFLVVTPWTQLVLESIDDGSARDALAISLVLMAGVIFAAGIISLFFQGKEKVR